MWMSGSSTVLPLVLLLDTWRLILRGAVTVGNSQNLWEDIYFFRCVLRLSWMLSWKFKPWENHRFTSWFSRLLLRRSKSGLHVCLFVFYIVVYPHICLCPPIRGLQEPQGPQVQRALQENKENWDHRWVMTIQWFCLFSSSTVWVYTWDQEHRVFMCFPPPVWREAGSRVSQV